MINWISTKERLPDEYGRYLVVGVSKKTKKLQIQVLSWYNSNGGYKIEGTKRWSNDGLMLPHKVQYWAELPKMPEECYEKNKK
jgi:hypothetical protein